MMVSVTRICAPLLVALLAGTSASGAQQQVRENQDITVIGQELRKEASSYVQQLGVVLGSRPAARWIDPVCPHVLGLAPQHAALVEAQVRAVATNVGAPLAPRGCAANFVIAFTGDGPGLVQQISKHQSLGEMTYEQRRELESGPAPIRWWITSEIRNDDGTPLNEAGSPALQTASAGVYANYQPPGLATGKVGSNGRGSSLVATPTQRVIRHAVVIVDANRSHGKKLSSVIDFAALVGLAEIQQSAAPPNSILNLFNSGAHSRLSTADLALLRGLYSLHMTRKADQHRRALIEKIAQARIRG